MNRGDFVSLFYSAPEPSQHIDEIYNFLIWYNSYHNKGNKIAEIGTFKGGTLKFWEYLNKYNKSNDDSLIISVDLNDRGWIPSLIEKYKEQEYIKFIIGDSSSDSVTSKFEQTLKGKKLDLLFIDGNHDYNYVKFDYNYYSKYVKSGGVIAFHDIVADAPKRVFEELTNNPKNYSSYITFFSDTNPCGIGIIIKK
jgi:cephalosporin hydroxylase